jgi:phosphotransferase system HPr-like phosphotransfer protein
MTILLDSVEKVKKFVDIAATFPCELDIKSGRYTVDAKSIMGIFSLDLKKPLTLVVFSPEYENKTDVFSEFEYKGE